MGFGPLGIWEILAIVGVALLIFGPTQLPKIARGVGKAVRSARDLKDEVTGAVLDEEAPKRKVRGGEPPTVEAAKRSEAEGDAPDAASDAHPAKGDGQSSVQDR